MITLNGIGISEGLALGKLFVFRSRGASSAAMNTEPLLSSDGRGLSLSAAESGELFRAARDMASAELTELAGSLRAAGQATAADLMDTHAALAEDPDFEDEVLARMEEAAESGAVPKGGASPHLSAADVISAVTASGETFAAMFEEMEGDMRLRAADIRDVAARIGRAVMRAAQGPGNDDGNTNAAQSAAKAGSEYGGRNGSPAPEIPLILAADDLSPSETASLDRTRISGIALSGGSAAGHTAILARSFGIPAVAGLGKEFEEICGELTLLLDGTTGTVVIDPDSETEAAFEARMREEAAEKARLEAFRGRETVTSEGRRVKLFCNIAGPGDVQRVKRGDGEGIGLFRSEFLFLSRDSAPTEEEQFEAYRAVLSQIPGEVTIRTMDIGADKKVSWLELPGEENPALGLRGLRLSLARPDLFRTQLRALYRASVFGQLRILFPMVASLRELEKAKELCGEVRADLAAEGLPFREVPLGIMIETPAAALTSDLLAPAADFFSVGTNDLTQYTLAVDRGASHLSDFSDPHHEAVFRLLELTVRNAHAAGIPVSICGELAADHNVTERLVSMGIDGLSVAPGAVLGLREEISLLSV